MKFVTYPSLKCQMGAWVYYMTSIRAHDLAVLVRFAHEYFPENDLDTVLQRRLTSRSSQIAKYLDMNEQRFFGSLIVAAYDGEPNFIPINLPDSAFFGELTPQPGLLRFDGTEKYYALDGQHRLAALKQVVRDNPDRYAKDEISVIIVCHTRDDEGIKRARRLFTTLNRYAKKTTKAEDAIMDEDSPADIYARRLVREHAFFRHRTKVLRHLRNGDVTFASGEAMPRGERQHLMAFLTLKRCNEALLPQEFKNSVIPQVLPNLDVLDDGYETLVGRWNQLIDNVAIWRALKDENYLLDQERGALGGNVLLRPIAIVAFVEACGEALDKRVPLDRIANVSSALSDLTKAPWQDLLWNVEARKMHDGQNRRRATKDIWRYYLGVENDKDKVVSEWLSASGRTRDSIDTIKDRDDV